MSAARREARRRLPPGFYAALFGAALLCSEARAQDANPAAQALYDQATAEMDAGKFESACKKLEEVVRLVPDGLGAKMTLAQCYEGMGRLASAWSQYTQVESLARKTGQAGRATKAASKAAALKRKLPSLIIDLARDAREVPGLEILRDGELVGQAQWGLALPVDKGAHTVTARAPGRKTWSVSVEVKEEGKSVAATVPVLDLEAAPAPSASATASASVTATAAPSSPPPPAPARSWQTPLGAITLAAGVAGLAAGGVFGGLALARRDDSIKAGCNTLNECPPGAAEIRNEARLFGDVSSAALIAGGALAAAGVVLLITAPRAAKSEPSSSKQSHLSVEIAPLFGGALVQGRF